MKNRIQKGPPQSKAADLADQITTLSISTTPEEWEACLAVIREHADPARGRARGESVEAAISGIAYEARIERAELKRKKDHAYGERNRLVAVLCAVFPTRYGVTDIAGWSDNWHHCVLIETPEGQLTWHVRDDQLAFFPDAGEWGDALEWDGHTTTDKYARLWELATQAQSMQFNLGLLGYATNVVGWRV